MDEAQSALGLARAESSPGDELDRIVSSLENDLWVLMAEVATAPANRHKLVDDETRVSPAMVERIEALIDSFEGRYTMPRSFVIPGQNRTSALLDHARTVVRRAERRAWEAELPEGWVTTYLNRLSDLCWVLARWQEHSPRFPLRPGGRRELGSKRGPAPVPTPPVPTPPVPTGAPASGGTLGAGDRSATGGGTAGDGTADPGTADPGTADASADPDKERT